MTTLADSKASSLAGQVGANARWARADEAERSKQSKAMLAGKRAKAIAAIDPEGQLTPDQLEKRLISHQRAEMARLTLARLRRKEGQQRGSQKA